MVGITNIVPNNGVCVIQCINGFFDSRFLSFVVSDHVGKKVELLYSEPNQVGGLTTRLIVSLRVVPDEIPDCMCEKIDELETQ